MLPAGRKTNPEQLLFGLWYSLPLSPLRLLPCPCMFNAADISALQWETFEQQGMVGQQWKEGEREREER